MKKSNIRHMALLTAVFGTLFLVLSSSSTNAGNKPAPGANNAADPALVPVNARFQGQTYGEWIAEWNQWYYNTVLAPGTPFFDTTGANFATGQSGPVWFLPWPAFRVIDRSITLPAGSSLLFPVHAVDALFKLPPNATDAQITAMGEALLERTATHIVNLVVEVDEVLVQNPWQYQFLSPTFDVDLPGAPYNFFHAPAGRYGPDIAEGLFYLVKPLSVGLHTIHYSMDFVNSGAFDGHWDVAYHVNVVPHSEE